MKIARFDSDKKMSIKGEFIEYPKELEGGRNLQTKSHFPNDVKLVPWGRNATQHKLFDGVITIYVDERDNAKGLRIAEKIIGDISVGKTYSISFDFKSDSVNELTYMYLLSSVDGNAGIGIVQNLITDSTWQRVVFDVVPRKNQRNAELLIATDPRRSSVALGSFSVKNLKIEEGEPTPWAPAPEDLGLVYPKEIQSFGTKADQKIMMMNEFVETEKASVFDGMLTASEFSEGVDI